MFTYDSIIHWKRTFHGCKKWTRSSTSSKAIEEFYSINNSNINSQELRLLRENINIEQDLEYDGSDDEAYSEESNSSNTITRAVIQFIMSKYPNALITYNNFQAIPVDTVIEKVSHKSWVLYDLYGSDL